MHTTANGKICYLEIPAMDIDRSVKFYTKVFGWKTRKRGDGAIAFEMGKFWRVRTPPIKSVSAVGSGDAFAAGLAAGRHRAGGTAGDPRAALALAAACGAANAMTTDSGWVRPLDLGEILPKVTVEEAD